MAYELLGDPGFHRELAACPPAHQNLVKTGLRKFLDHPLHHPKATRLKGAKYPGSFRLRIGDYRILGIVLDGPKLVFLTTLFFKKRDSDYDQAIQRYERRMEAQGPPLGDYLRSVRRR